MGSQLLTTGAVRGGCLEEESSVPGLHERAHGQIRQQKELVERHHMTLSHLGHWRAHWGAVGMRHVEQEETTSGRSYVLCSGACT